MEIKVLVACHKPYPIAADPVYYSVEAGAALRPVHPDMVFRDDCGENISFKNGSYCELTALYWGWKNLESEALGLVHYRRYLGAKRLETKWQRIARRADLEALLEKYPVIVPKPRNYFIETNYSQYQHAHNSKDLDLTRRIIANQYSAYLPAFDRVMSRTYGHRFNMFIMRRNELDGYCTWLFSILAGLEKEIDLSAYDEYNRRVFGFIAERLLDCYLETNHITYTELPVVNLESQHWPRKILRFLQRKLKGGRAQ